MWLARRTRSPLSLEGDVALVTGGSRGLGYLLAERLLGEGCRVAICGRDEETLERARRRLLGAGRGEVAAFVCDVSDAGSVEDMVRRVVRRFGSIDLLVNNAAGIEVGPLQSFEAGDFRRALDVICMGAVHTALAALPHMRARGRGRIVNVTSIGGKVAVPHLLPYDCGKFALVGFSEGLRSAVSKDGIVVTTVVPGLMRTGSPVHVEFRGRPEQEYRWFALSDLLPLTAMGAGRAADRIVLAARRGEAEVVLSWQAKVVRVCHALSPGGMSRLLGVVNRLLPDSGDARGVGRDMQHVLPGPARQALRSIGRRTNQWPSKPPRRAPATPD